jgi:hypothetical protein
VYLHLYLVMDVWSRKIVGWRIAEADSARIAAELITETCRNGNVDPRGLLGAILERRHALYQHARSANPERWSTPRGMP